MLVFQNAQAWQFGDGYDIGDFHFSGYSNIELESPRTGNDLLKLDDLSLFVSGKINRYLNPFMEAEVSSVPFWQESDGLKFDHANFVLERLYNDIQITDNDIFRIGKMLTPVGEWNRIHAAPLVWTSSRPVTTYYSFPEYSSGASYKHQFTEIDGLSIEFYTQPADDVLRKPLSSKVPRYYRQVAGGNIDYYFGLNNKLGISGQYADTVLTNEDQWLLSVDGQFRIKKLQIEFQTTATKISGGRQRFRDHDNDLEINEPKDLSDINGFRAHDTEWGGYLQLAYNFYDKWNLIGRGEYFQAREFSQAHNNELIGLVYRPSPAISYKFEYVFSNGANLGLDTGFYSSLALLF